MSNLPNNNDEKIKVYPNEYITNITVNRPNLRLLENDLYLENMVSGYDPNVLDGLSGEVDTNAADITTNAGDITTNAADIILNAADISSLSSTILSAAIFVDPPSSVSALGNDFEVAISGEYLYMYHNLSGSLNWGRTILSYVW